MSSASRFPALPDWRTVAMVLACAVAGWGLRWTLDKREAPARQETAARNSLPVPPPLTVKSLPALSYQGRMVAIAANLPGMTVAEIAPLVETLTATVQEGGSGEGTPESTKLILRALFMRWAELDAPGMITALEAPAFRFSLTTRQFAVSAWAELQGLTAVKAVEKQWPGIANIAAWEILRRKPEEMDALLPHLHVRSGGYPDAELSLAEVLGIERFAELATALDQQWFVSQALGNTAKEDVPRALRIAKSLPPGGIRDSSIVEVLERLDPRQREPAEEAVRGLDFRREYDALPPGNPRNSLAETYAALLAKENPAAALEWAAALPRGDVRSKALGSVIDDLPEEMSPGDKIRLSAEAWRAEPLFVRFAPGGEFQKWHDDDAKAAEAWLATVTDPSLRAAIETGSPKTSATPEQSVETRAKTLAAIIEDGVKDDAWAAAGTEDRRLLAGEAMRYRGRIVPQDALKFFDAMSPDERSLDAWYLAGGAKAESDVEKASQWVKSLPPGAERDAAATALVEYLTGVVPEGAGSHYGTSNSTPANQQDPEAAFAWAASMSGEIERSRYMSRAARAWAVQDAAAARAAVDAGALPEAEKQSLLRQLPPAAR